MAEKKMLNPRGIEADSMDEGPDQALELSIVMPGLNETETLEVCIRKAQESFRKHGIEGDVIFGPRAWNSPRRWS
jgi:hypothetical protein